MKKILIFTILFIASTISAGSFYTAEFDINGGSTSNLFKSHEEYSDVYTSLKGSINLYPSDFAEVNINSEYTKYNDFSDLSNMKYGGGLTVIPFNDSSKFKLFISGQYYGYKYKDVLTTNSSEFSDKDANGKVSFGYAFSSNINARTGVYFTSTGFASDSVSDKNFHNIFTGINVTAFGHNSFDIEGGFCFEKYDYVPEYRENYIITPFDTIKFTDIYIINPNEAYAIQKKSDLKSLYISSRLSRPVGNKTGLSLLYAYRGFTETQDSSVVYGYSTGYLSPWLNSYEGSTIQLKLKTYMLPHFILSAGFGYWDKAYLKVIESEGGVVSTVSAKFRKDDSRKYFLTIQLPFVTASGNFFEPTLNIEYTNNSSNIHEYEYTDFTVTTKLNIRL